MASAYLNYRKAEEEGGIYESLKDKSKRLGLVASLFIIAGIAVNLGAYFIT